MNKRLKELRKYLGLNQTKFASKIGMSQQAYAFLETGRTQLKDRQIKPICSIYHVSERWLKEGEGEMFGQASDEEVMLDAFRNLTKEEQYYVLKFIDSLKKD